METIHFVLSIFGAGSIVWMFLSFLFWIQDTLLRLKSLEGTVSWLNDSHTQKYERDTGYFREIRDRLEKLESR